MYYSESNTMYWVLLIILFIISLVIQASLNSKYKKYSKVRPASGITGGDAAKLLLSTVNAPTKFGRTNRGALSDFYSPKEDTIYLSEDNSSIASIGVACHEAGHAIQYAVGYAPAKLRLAIIPACNFGSRLSIPFIIVGLLLASLYSEKWYYLAYIGIALFGLALLAQLITLPVEFDASRRAIKGLRELNILTKEELKGVKKILTSAAMTYLVATLVTVVQLLRFTGLVRRD